MQDWPLRNVTALYHQYHCLRDVSRFIESAPNHTTCASREGVEHDKYLELYTSVRDGLVPYILLVTEANRSVSDLGHNYQNSADVI